jgi:hypothetical protein
MEVKMPRGKYRQDIARAYRSKEDYHGEADPLSPQELIEKRNLLLGYNYHWLHLSVFLGLRPEEVDSLKDKKTFRVDAQDGTPILWVFQSKLVGVSEEEAWKPIPLILREQEMCLEIIASGDFKRPLNKTLRKIFTSKRITGYSGRKAFTDLMLSDAGKNQNLEEISIWMGHKTIETTWKHYKQKQVVRFKKAA